MRGGREGRATAVDKHSRHRTRVACGRAQPRPPPAALVVWPVVRGRKFEMKVTRRFTKPGTDALASVRYEKRTSRIANPDGSVVFEMNDAEIPVTWSQLATDIMVSKYFRKAGVPQVDEHGQQLRDGEGN